MTGRRVLVTGAGGKTGRAVITAVAARGVSVRAMVRDLDRHADLADLGADVEVVRGDQREVDDVLAALEGVSAAYAIAPNVSSHERAMTRAIVTACQTGGVSRLVLHSVVHPQLSAMPHHADKAAGEELVLESGLDWTILQPNVYLQNLSGYEQELRQGRYRVPYASDRGLAMVDLRDVAEVAADCLVEGRGVHAIFELSGPAEVTPAQIAAMAGELLGRRVVAERQDPDAWLEANGHLDVDTRQRLHAMFRHYDQHGCPGEETVLRALLGREPRDLRGYLEELFG
jgi:NAD(P)H dehydrogenase (quinone)